MDLFGQVTQCFPSVCGAGASSSCHFDLKDEFTQKWKCKDYLLSLMLMDGKSSEVLQLTKHFWSSQQHSFAAFS